MKNKLLLAFLCFLCLNGQPLFAQAPPAGFSSVVESTGWNEAVGLTFNRTGSDLFVWERPGTVWTVRNGQKHLLLDISEEVGGWRDFGLLGFALHPDFATNGYFYVLYTVDRHHLMHYGTPSYSSTADEYYNATINRLTRYRATRTAEGYAVDLSSRTILIGATPQTGIAILHTSHGPGSLVFGTDGSLLVSSGDGASFDSNDVGSAGETYYAQGLIDGIISQEQNVGALRAQQLESYSGKVLRIDPMTGNGLPNNPFYQSSAPNSVKSKVWALGLRNPFRMTLKPGTGSATDPGVLYIGDVGNNSWEEINAAVRPGMNFGWPLFEGLTQQDGYWYARTANRYAPTSGGCAQPYYYFQDLITQETPTGSATFANPCATGQVIPASTPTFVHSRPLIDWNHQGTGPSRTGIFTGNMASEINIGASGSPVSGPQFGGSSAMGGVFYPHNDFPAEYRNTCFIGDYPGGWIRSLSVDGNNKPVAVRNFVDQGAIVVAMATHPTEGGLYYVNFYPSEIRKVVYHAPVSTSPVAVASANKTYGSGPLTVQFTGSASYDVDSPNLTYLWNFGDGATSTAVNPSHTFASGQPTNYNVTLTVRDATSAGQTSLVISANNTPPQVAITSPAVGTKYPLTGQATYTLQASASDQEHSSSQLSYQWQTTLHHDDHSHPEPIVTTPQASTTTSPLGCGSEVYHYTISLKVTDALGLAATSEVALYPDCSSPVNQPPVANAGADITLTLPTATATLRGTGADPDGSISSYNWTQVGGAGASVRGADTPNLTVSNLTAGSYTFRLTVTDNTNASASDEVTIIVNPAVSTGPQVLRFALVNDDTEQILQFITEGETLNLAAYPTTSFNIRAITNAATTTIGRVEFVLTGAQRSDYTDKQEPHEAIKKSPGKKAGWLPLAGNYTLVATPYARPGGGTAGIAGTVRFRVTYAHARGASSNSAALPVTTSASALPATSTAVGYQSLVVSCYPNPFTDQFTVHVQGRVPRKLPVRVYDMVGRELLFLEDLPTGEPVSLGGTLNAGVYTLMVGSGTEAKRFRIVKAK
ncbi:PQQ-dependent sugar dehydrogenase [Hymenobacter tibetensis]|uniref:PQQ-dependent sugar dehydrogenase n=1 Tax=Hymenobacter tibetensis TaxID=497967 RepID=A0ABY4CZ08_9BACT|nr:PQQ-dependent sugar dehydrogenase [Hymenobacter tibetensis]UOG75292.1 PQQ-dependent sugar dehydrogenase [Hymenobacter tibetensis]